MGYRPAASATPHVENIDMTTQHSDMKEITVRRDGDRDLEFIGVELGSGSFGTGGTSGYSCDWNRGTDVTIYRTQGGRYVVAVRQWSCWQGERDAHRATACDTAADVLAWLIEDAGGQLGRASKEALEAAAASDEDLAAVLTEWIE